MNSPEIVQKDRAELNKYFEKNIKRYGWSRTFRKIVREPALIGQEALAWMDGPRNTAVNILIEYEPTYLRGDAPASILRVAPIQTLIGRTYVFSWKYFDRMILDRSNYRTILLVGEISELNICFDDVCAVIAFYLKFRLHDEFQIICEDRNTFKLDHSKEFFGFFSGNSSDGFCTWTRVLLTA